MFVGELDYGGLPLHNFFDYVVFIIFVFIVVIVIMNLLTSVAIMEVQEIKNASSDMAWEMLAMKMNFWELCLIRLEFCFGFCFRNCILTSLQDHQQIELQNKPSKQCYALKSAV